MLKRADVFAEKEDITEQSAMEFVVDALEDKEREEKMLKLAVMMLLWAGSFIYGPHILDGLVPNVRSLLGEPAAGQA